MCIQSGQFDDPAPVMDLAPFSNVATRHPGLDSTLERFVEVVRGLCTVHCAHPVPSGTVDLQSMDVEVYFFYFHFRKHTHVPRVRTLHYWLGCMY